MNKTAPKKKSVSKTPKKSSKKTADDTRYNIQFMDPFSNETSIYWFWKNQVRNATPSDENTRKSQNNMNKTAPKKKSISKTSKKPSKKTAAKTQKTASRKPKYGTRGIGEEIEEYLNTSVFGKKPTAELVKVTKAEIKKISKAHFKPEQYDTMLDVWAVADDVYGMILFRDKTWSKYATINFNTNVNGRTPQQDLESKINPPQERGDD